MWINISLLQRCIPVTHGETSIFSDLQFTLQLLEQSFFLLQGPFFRGFSLFIKQYLTVIERSALREARIQTAVCKKFESVRRSRAPFKFNPTLSGYQWEREAISCVEVSVESRKNYCRVWRQYKFLCSNFEVDYYYISADQEDSELAVTIVLKWISSLIIYCSLWSPIGLQ